MEDDGPHRGTLLHLEGRAQIALQIVLDVVPELDMQGLVEPVFRFRHGDLFRRGLLCQKRAAGDSVHQQKGDDHDQEQDQDRANDPLENICAHGPSFPYLPDLADKKKTPNLLGNFQKNYNIFPSTRIYQTNEELILGLINYKYKRKRKMSEDAKDATFIDVFNNFKIKEEEPLDKKEKENRRLAMMNQVDMALKYNNVLKVKQLMNDEDFLLLSDKDKISINLNSRLASLELYEIKQAIEKEKVNKLKLSWEKQVNEENNQADNKTK